MKLFRAKSTKLEAVKLCFGVPLEPTLNSIPPIVEKCTRWLLKHGTKTEGVFRLSANQATLDELVSRFDRGENVDLESPLNLQTSAGRVTAVVETHCVSALLKRWFRELPEPLCTLEMYDMWMAAASINDAQTKILQVKKVLSFLPQSNQILIKYLASFLGEFSKHSEATKMTTSNLSICFAPNLLRPPESIGLADQIEESPIATGLLVMFIEYYDTLFDLVQTDSTAISFSADTGANGKSNPKINLTDNLLPPPPVTSPKSETAPSVPLKKPTPKYAPPKKSASPKPNRIDIPAQPPSSSSNFHETAPVPSPPTSPLPPPLSLSPHPIEDEQMANIALPPPITAPKPKLRQSQDGKQKLRKSAKKSKNSTEKKESEASQQQNQEDISNSSPNSPTLPSPISSSITPPIDSVPVTTNPTVNAVPARGPPPARPASSAPSFK